MRKHLSIKDLLRIVDHKSRLAQSPQLSFKLLCFAVLAESAVNLYEQLLGFFVVGMFFEEGDQDRLCHRPISFFDIVTRLRKQLLRLFRNDLLRFLISGKHTKSRYNVRYSDLKELGYRSLVNEYYLEP